MFINWPVCLPGCVRPDLHPHPLRCYSWLAGLHMSSSPHNVFLDVKDKSTIMAIHPEERGRDGNRNTLCSSQVSVKDVITPSLLIPTLSYIPHPHLQESTLEVRKWSTSRLSLPLWRCPWPSSPTPARMLRQSSGRWLCATPNTHTPLGPFPSARTRLSHWLVESAQRLAEQPRPWSSGRSVV